MGTGIKLISEIEIADLENLAPLSAFIEHYLKQISTEQLALNAVIASKVLISGTTHLNDWTAASDTTKIDGGDIYTNTITAIQINADEIEAGHIKADAITTVKINNAAVDTTKLSAPVRALIYLGL